jgi:hypothetical protein
VQEEEPVTQADRLAFINLFKEIAAIGRQARERRAAALATQSSVDTENPQPITDREVQAG